MSLPYQRILSIILNIVLIFSIFMKEISMMKLDAIDRQILTLLQAAGRLSNADLADKVGLSPSACHRRVKALESAGIIADYVALLDEAAFGRTSSVFVQVTLDNQRTENLSHFEEAVAACPEIMECYLTTGEADYHLRVLVRDAADYEHVHHKVLTRLPGVTRVVSNFAIRRVFRRTALPV